MASKLETIIQVAIKTFRKPLKMLTECTQSELSELKTLTEDIGPEDIKKLETLLKNGELKDVLQIKKTTLDYLSVYEDDNISVGVFLLQQDAKLPIHDHPNMFGIIKVLEGVLRITSYSVVEIDKTTPIDNDNMYYRNPIKVVKHPDIRLGKGDHACVLSPSDRNIHEVECIEGPAAFLDILSPPYEEGEASRPRACHFFKEVPSKGQSSGKETSKKQSSEKETSKKQSSEKETSKKQSSERNSSSKQEDNYLRLVQIPSPF